MATSTVLRVGNSIGLSTPPAKIRKQYSSAPLFVHCVSPKVAPNPNYPLRLAAIPLFDSKADFGRKRANSRLQLR